MMVTNTQRVAWPGVLISVENGGHYEESNALVPDKNWRFVDTLGHGHFAEGRSYPTLRWVSLECSMGHDDECPGDGYWVCRYCEECVIPEQVAAGGFWVDGPNTYTVELHDVHGKRIYRLNQNEFDELGERVLTTINNAAETYQLVEASYGA